MKELLESTISRVFVSVGEEYIKFVSSYHWVEPTIYETTSECCSETWFADIIGIKNLIGKSVIGIEVIPITDACDNRTRQESDEVYGYKLKTELGYTDIIFRNSSNGYYGGAIQLWTSEQEPDVKWIEITDDWQAPGN